MNLQKVSQATRKVAQHLRCLLQPDSILTGVLCVLSFMTLLAVLSHASVPFIFIAALCGGGWATSRVTSHEFQVGKTRGILQLMPDLVDRCKEKRKELTLPDVNENLKHYSVKEFTTRHSEKDGTIFRNTQCLHTLPVPAVPVSLKLTDTVDKELQHLLKNVMLDFISSWYDVYISDHNRGSELFLEHLLQTSMNLCNRLASIEKRTLVTKLLLEFRIHVYQFRKATSSLRKLPNKRNGKEFEHDSSSLVASYEMMSLLHPAIQGADMEADFLRSTMDILVNCAVPKSVTQCRASTLIIVEILTCNILLPLLDLLSDPDFLYRLILLIVSSSVSEGGPKAPAESNDVSKCSKLEKPNYQSEETIIPMQSSYHIDQSHHLETGVTALAADPTEQNFLFKQTPATACGKPDATSKKRLPFETDTSQSIQSNESAHRTRRPLQPSLSFPICRSKSTDPINDAILSKVHNGLSFMYYSSSTVPVAPLLDHAQSTLPNSLPKMISSPKSVGTNPKVHRRSASDTSCNPAFISGDLLSHVTLNPWVTPRPPAEGAEIDDLIVTRIPLTGLEPAILIAPENEDSAEVFPFINSKPDDLNSPLTTGIDCQFPFDESVKPQVSSTVDAAQIDEAVEIFNSTDDGVETYTRTSVVDNGSNDNTTDGSIMRPIPQSSLAEKPDIDVPSSPINKLLRRLSIKTLSVPDGPTQNIQDMTQDQVHKSDATKKELSPARVSSCSTSLLPIDDQATGSSSIIPSAENPRIISITSQGAEEPIDACLTSEVHSSESLEAVADRVGNLLIPKAEVCKETSGKSEFFMYSIQFDVQPVSPLQRDCSQTCDDSLSERRLVKRRHREFVNLHSRLDHNPELKASLKGLRDVPKRISIPLAPTAKPAIQQRRFSLQNYLQQLLAKPLLHSSIELREFLALEGNSHVEYVRHQPRIDKLLMHRMSGLVDTFKSALPRALSDQGPMPPISSPNSPIRKTKSSRSLSPSGLPRPGSPRPGSPTPGEEQDGIERMVTFGRRPKTTLQLAMDSIIQDHNRMKIATLSRNPSSDNDVDSIGLRSEGDGSESPAQAVSETDSPLSPAQAVSETLSSNPGSVFGSEETSLFDAVMSLLGEALHDKESWFLDEGFQNVLTRLAGGLLDGWIERQVQLLFSEHWCAFYLSELRQLLWPDGKLLSASDVVRTEAEKASTKEEVLESFVDLMPDSFYTFVDKQDWKDGLQLLLDSLGDPQLNRHLVFTALDLLMDSLIAEIQDEDFQKDLLSRV
ncbi:sorting nexin-19-like [Asterias rubens]|uniref:sorting nexin-19-like n=1 Tax=Asterias rubens TaxID=7604 RepID=UPI0014554BB5|nr:sorting nexin-19-like [Asterias rubens]